MLNKAFRLSTVALALVALTVPASQMRGATKPPTVVTGGDPQPTGEIILHTALILNSLIVL